MNPSSYRLFVRLPLCLTLFSLVFMGVFAKRGFLDYRRMLEKNRELTTRMVDTRKQVESLAMQIDALKNSTDEQERMIRAILGFTRKNDIVIEFD